MKIAKIHISNILGIAELEFTPEGFTEITGQNGTGKTSVLEAIKSAVSGGHDATLLRKGAEHGEVVLVLDDGAEIKKRVTESGSKTDIIRDGKKVSRPSDLIKSLTDMLSLNPINFLHSPKKDRVKVLLETMPIRVDAAELSKISGVPVEATNDVHALHVIEKVRAQIYDERTGTNRAVKEKDATINQLRLALPDVPGGATGSEAELLEQVAAANAAKDAELERIRTKLEGIKKDNQDKIDAIRAKAQEEIDAIRNKAVFEVESIQALQTEIEGKAAAQRERAIKLHTDAVTPINETLSAIRANRANAAKREQALETINTLTKELEDLCSDAERQSKAITDIDDYKAKLLAELPIPGLEVRDGEIFRNGVNFDRLNTAQQVDIAVEIAKLRAGELGVVCVDGIELLDSAAFEAFRDRALESGLQLFVTRVSDQEFEVKTYAADA